MGGSVGNSDGPMADINVTPLIDVVLVLLVVFMVITPLLSSGLKVDLPQATMTETSKEGGQHIVVSITKDLEYAVDQDRYDTPDEVAVAVQIAYRESPNPEERRVLVKADKSVSYGEARKILDALAARNVGSQVYLATAKEH